MIAYQNIYDSLADFIATMDADKVLAFYTPDSLQERVEYLLEKNKTKASRHAKRKNRITTSF